METIKEHLSVSNISISVSHLVSPKNYMRDSFHGHLSEILIFSSWFSHLGPKVLEYNEALLLESDKDFFLLWDVFGKWYLLSQIVHYKVFSSPRREWTRFSVSQLRLPDQDVQMIPVGQFIWNLTL